MDVYGAETTEILRRYNAGLMTRSACITALSAAVDGLEPFLQPGQLKTLRDSMSSTHNALGTKATEQ